MRTAVKQNDHFATWIVLDRPFAIAKNTDPAATFGDWYRCIPICEENLLRRVQRGRGRNAEKRFVLFADG